jgi:PBP1b-binding outer membrane lipoprotein LpoB
MNKLLRINNTGNIEIDNDFLAYKEFKSLPAKQLQDIAKFLYLVYNPSSDLYDMKEEDKVLEGMNQCNLKVISEDVKIAVDKYKDLIRKSSPTLSAIDSALSSIYTMTKMTNKIDSLLQDRLEECTIEELPAIQASIKANIDSINKMPECIKTLKELKEKYKAEISEEGSLIGNQQTGFIH